MASLNYPESGTSYCGLPEIFGFTNYDGVMQRANCGQAACATFLTFHRQFSVEPPLASRLMDEIEGRFPPDNLGGFFGTSRRRVTQACRAFGVRVQVVEGEEALKEQLKAGNPVIVMLGVSGGRFLGWELPGGHWMVAYGFDDEQVYLTNHGSMTWPEFRAGWAAWVPRLIGMRNCGLVAERKE